MEISSFIVVFCDTGSFCKRFRDSWLYSDRFPIHMLSMPPRSLDTLARKSSRHPGLLYHSTTHTFFSTIGANFSRQVIEYLSKKGYSRTEAMLRAESANQDVDGRPLSTRTEEAGGVKYGKAFGKLSCDSSSQLRRAMLSRFLQT